MCAFAFSLCTCGIFLLCFGQCVSCTFTDDDDVILHNRANTSSRHTRSPATPAPINCKLMSWSAWSPCNSCRERKFRFQYLERPSQFGGQQCVHSQWDERQCPEEGDCQPQDHCGEMFACGPNGRCIGQQLRCNDETDCLSHKDELECDVINKRETKCTHMLAIPGAEKSTQGYNAVSGTFMSHVLDPNYYGGICDYVYNGEWRKLIYDPFCEHIGYEDDEKYYQKPYNFLSYQLVAQATTEESSDYYEDAVSFLNAVKTESSSNVGGSFGINQVEVGVEAGHQYSYIRNISQYNSKEVGFIRLLSKVQTAQFKMRSKDLMLDEDMLRALSDLPDQYNFPAYSHFFNEYGTHYITEGTMGGVLDYVAVVNKNAMRRQELQGGELGFCLGGSLGLAVTENVSTKLKAKHCAKEGWLQDSIKTSNSVIEDVFHFVKGGHTGPSSRNLVIRDAKSYRIWGKSLKYNPVLIDFEILPIYELMRFSTAAEQLREKIPYVKMAWEEYMQIFNTCHCAPCMNNGVPVLSRTSCSCMCKNGYSGVACEETQRTGPTHGSWSCWTSWSSCTSGTKMRKRECNNPSPENGGLVCRGSNVHRKNC